MLPEVEEVTSTGKGFGPDWLSDKISAGELVIIDGPMGTELEARDVPMNARAWSATALLSHPDAMRAAHADNIDAVAEVITTNTFATGQQLLDSAGLGDQMQRLNTRAVEIARQARDESGNPDIAIAGSMSPWVVAGSSPSRARLADEFRKQAELLASAGVDLIALEMCSHPDYSRLIADAAVATGLPVWLGLSCKQDEDTGEIVGFEEPHADFRQLILELADCGASVITIMHSSVDDTTMGLSLLREIWDGPVGAYPESGYFVMPNWQFVDIIEPAELVRRAQDWVDDGVQILGGCCGLGVQHIRALKTAFG